MCRDVVRIAGRGTWHAGGTPIVPTHPQMKKVKQTHKTKWLLAIMCLEDQRPKQAYCDSDRFQVSPLGVL